ncbi:hypothetical protein [Bacillus sp. V2I10]|uniref:hypothetical protein n=1 Tax=Bacillus sp. V2I10 TaxID=3042276 RepID=UPI0027D7C9B4|nr:hypothetical protein [Bacillus sp. V2I10]
MNVREFNNNPDEEAARVALGWFKQVKRDFIYEVDLYKVLYNQIDITDLVKAKEVKHYEGSRSWRGSNF